MRERCAGRCHRPLSVCLCSHLPSPPFLLRRCRLLLLQHPHESRRKLSTLPLLSACLSPACHRILTGRALTPSAIAAALLLLFPRPLPQGGGGGGGAAAAAEAAEGGEEEGAAAGGGEEGGGEGGGGGGGGGGGEEDCDGIIDGLPPLHILLLFPSPAAQPISEWFSQHASTCPRCNCLPDDDAHDRHGRISSSSSSKSGDLMEHDAPAPSSSSSPPPSSKPSPHILLIVLDATWQHAREMMRATSPFLSDTSLLLPSPNASHGGDAETRRKVELSLVCLPFDEQREGPSMCESDSILRKEPFHGCLSTLEAVACCLKVLEPDGGDIHGCLLSLLRAMVRCQSSNIRVHKARKGKP